MKKKLYLACAGRDVWPIFHAIFRFHLGKCDINPAPDQFFDFMNYILWIKNNVTFHHMGSITLAFWRCSLGVSLLSQCDSVACVINVLLKNDIKNASDIETHTLTAHPKRKCNHP
jgi:hypothetical protein